MKGEREKKEKKKQEEEEEDNHDKPLVSVRLSSRPTSSK